MASKNTDIIEQLADTIVANLTTPIAKRGKETAPNDKTYSSIILGVNQKFTDNVSEDEQSEIIEKFSIPETVEEGEDNYYTFKINGVYYCKSQNGDFKLYDKIMVYIPNGNWSNIYFDYADGVSHNSGGGGGSDTELPDYIVSPDMPGGGDCNIGDLWIVTNDETITEFTNLTEDTFVNMYEYKADENEVIDWRLVKVCIAEASSKVDVINDDYWIKTDENNVFTEIDMWETSGSTTSFYEIYPNPERETAPNVSIYNYSPLKLGDYWYEIDSDVNKNLEARWIYSFNPETNRNEYKNEYNIQGGSGGVGQACPRNAERFNDYSSYTLDGADTTGGTFANSWYDHVDGYHNHSIMSSHEGGFQNYGYNRLGGRENSFYQADTSDGFGRENTGYDVQDVFVRGRSNKLSTITDSFFLGNANRITGASGIYVFGGGNTWTYNGRRKLSGIRVIGNGNKLCRFLGILIGDQNDLTSEDYPDSDICYVPNAVLAVSTHATYKTISSTLSMNVEMFCKSYSTTEFAVERFNGNIHAAGSYLSDLGADYAEYFEWLDGNPENEDRRGLLVNFNAADTLDEYDTDCEKIYLADGDDFIGAVSANPSVIGDAATLDWHGKYEHDVFGAPKTDKEGALIISNSYVEGAYKPRRMRPEWAPIGLMGKLIVVDNGKCKPGNYIQAQNGTAIPCDHPTRARMMRRIDENHIKILLI